MIITILYGQTKKGREPGVVIAKNLWDQHLKSTEKLWTHSKPHPFHM